MNKINTSFKTFLLLVVLLLGTSKSTLAQVSSYIFARTAGTYTSIPTGGTTVIMGNSSNDDDSFDGIALPFAFTYGGTVFSHFAVNSNGFISLGTNASINISPLNIFSLSNIYSNNNIISPFSADLASTPTGALSRVSLGTAPNRTLVIQWKDYSFSGSTESINFQIRLSEGSNNIQFVYGTFSNISAYFAQVGLRGASIGDFNNRITTALNPNWLATIPGTVNNDTAICELDVTVFPPNGTIFTWTSGASCTGTPTAGTATTTNTSVCALLSTFSLGLTGNTAGTGITYQWQSSPLPVGTYTNISGATTAIYATTQTVSTSYQ